MKSVDNRCYKVYNLQCWRYSDACLLVNNSLTHFWDGDMNVHYHDAF